MKINVVIPLLIILLLCSTATAFAQKLNLYPGGDTTKIFAIQRFARYADSLHLSPVEFKMRSDSIEIWGNDYGEKIETTVFLINQPGFLKINFYLKNQHLVAANVKEQSRILTDLNRYTEYYFEQDIVFFTRSYCNVRSCLARSTNPSSSEMNDYNPMFTGKSLDALLPIIYDRIKPATSNSKL